MSKASSWESIGASQAGAVIGASQPAAGTGTGAGEGHSAASASQPSVPEALGPAQKPLQAAMEQVQEAAALTAAVTQQLQAAAQHHCSLQAQMAEAAAQVSEYTDVVLQAELGLQRAQAQLRYIEVEHNTRLVNLSFQPHDPERVPSPACADASQLSAATLDDEVDRGTGFRASDSCFLARSLPRRSRSRESAHSVHSSSSDASRAMRPTNR